MIHSQLNKAISHALADMVERSQVWDADPELLRVYVAGRVVTMVPVQVPRLQWEAFGGTAAGLERIAEVMAMCGITDREPTEHGTLHAVAFLHEGWTVWPEPSMNDHHAWRRVQKMAADHRLYQHPDAVEVRACVAVDRDGWTYQAEHKRGHIGVVRRVMAPDDPETKAAGIVVEALDRMVTLLTGAALGPRPDARVQTGEMN
jgi:hypothetical protein